MKIKLINSRHFVRTRLSLLIMRMIIFLLCTTVFGLTSKTSFSQEKVIINQDQSVSVDEIFNLIQQQTNYHFIFPKKLFKNAPSVFLKKGEALVISLLEKSLQNSNLEFQVDDNNTILIKKNENSNAKQQKVTVNGKVFDAYGIPLPGVTVLEKGTSNGVATDFSGTYNISVANNATIEFSFIGFQTKAVSVADLTYFSNVEITLAEDVNALDEVVVTGYQTLSKERTTGSFETVSAEQLQQRPSSSSFADRIVGQVPGVNINPVNGKIQVRGQSSLFSGSSDILVVVDGYPLTQQTDFNTINPEDIETLTVLKDASASSVWGARASNGVVVIVTKKGKKDKKMTVDYSSFIEFEEKVNLDDSRFLDVSGEIDVDLEYLDKNWVTLSTIPLGTSSINDLHTGILYRNGLMPDGNIWSQNTYNNFINDLRGREDVTKQFEDYLLRNALRQTHNLSISGGGNKNTIYASMSYTDYKAASIGNEDNRLTMNLRNVFDFNDKIKFTAGINATLRKDRTNGIDVSVANQLQPYDQIVDQNGQYIQQYANYNPWVSQAQEALVGSPLTFNILEEQRNKDNSKQFLDFRADFRLDVELFDGFTMSPSLRYERGAGNADNYRDMSLPSHRNLINKFFVNNNYQIPVGSDYERIQNTYEGWTMRNTFNYDKTFGKHDITLFGGLEYNKRYSESDINRAFGYNRQATLYIAYDQYDLFRSVIRDFNNDRIDGNTYRENNFKRVLNDDDRFVSYYANAGYAYNKKYLINASYRVDQANLWGSDPEFRYKPLWSVGAGWRIAEEDFMNNVSWINSLTLRGTYGLGGNTLISNASPYAVASSRTNSASLNYPYFFSRFSSPANPGLKWEETATTNFALDFGLLNNKLSGSIEYYIRKSSDVYGSNVLDPTVGFTRANVNYADIENKGFEVQLNATIIDTKDFGWNVRANFNKNENIITRVNSFNSVFSLTEGSNDYSEGIPVNFYYNYRFAGLDVNGEATFFNRDDVVTDWATANSSFTLEDVEFSGSQVPQVYGGLQTTVRYKGFDLTANLNYGADYVFRYRTNFLNTGYGTYNQNFSSAFVFNNIRLDQVWGNRWRNPGDENSTNVPRMFYNGLNPNTGKIESTSSQSTQDRLWSKSDIHMHKGDFIRVQDIILGYTFSNNLLNNTFLNSLRFTLQATNPFLWVANDLGVDPAAPQSPTANLKRFTFGIRANF